MSSRYAAGNRLFATRWVHVFEEDGASGALYRPADDNIPLSRRPRDQFELDADGTAHVYVGGADDRAVASSAAWRDDNGVIVITPHKGTRTLRIVQQARDRLVVHLTSTS